MNTQILIVDDDENLCDTTRDILENAGYRVFTAGSLAMAMAHLQNTAIDAMIVDLNLPDGTGLQLAGQARSQFPQIRIILMTGQDDGSNPAGLAPRGDGIVDDHLVKPVSPPQLMMRLQRILS